MPLAEVKPQKRSPDPQVLKRYQALRAKSNWKRKNPTIKLVDFNIKLTRFRLPDLLPAEPEMVVISSDEEEVGFYIKFQMFIKV